MRQEETAFVLSQPLAGREQRIALRDRELTVYIHDCGQPDAPVLFEMHGGGYALGHAAKNDALRERICGQGIHVVGVNYRKSPEHIYPAPLDDVCDCVRWLTGHGRELGLTCEQVFLCGESAGANLAQAAALRLIREGYSRLSGQILHYPCLDMVTPYQEKRHRKYPTDFEESTSRAFDELYCPTDYRGEAYVSPILTPKAELAALPPTLIITAGRDYLKFEAKKFFDRLAEAGAEAYLDEEPDAHHGYIEDWFNPACYANTAEAVRALHAPDFGRQAEEAIDETVEFILRIAARRGKPVQPEQKKVSGL